VTDDPPLRQGWVAPELGDEFPDLRLTIAEIEATDRHTPRVVKQRLATLSNRFHGARAVTLRQEPVPWAYRVFFRQVGIDPDVKRTPIEQIAIDRLQHGGFQSRGLVADALLIATLETGVPVRAFDAALVTGKLGLRLTNVNERLGGDGRNVARRQLAIADETHALAVLFGDAAVSVLPGRKTRRILLAAIVVKGVPALAVEEALWSAAEVLSETAS
jgi:DNA/RNA-binding domain of Phe-tRNA-synthetase-like protein